MSVYIETERLILREFIDDDVEGLFKLDSDPLVHKYLGNKPIKTKNKALQYIQDCKIKYKVHGICRLAVIEKESGDFIGWSGLRFHDKDTLNNQTNYYDVGYRFIPKYWNKGYATESGIASLKFGFDVLKLEIIVGITESENLASQKSLLKIGLSYIEDFYDKNLQKNLKWYSIKNNKL